MTIFLLACATVVVVSFLCSLLEATLLSLDSIHLETRRREGFRYAAVWQEMKRRIDRPIAAILILNTVAHTGGATVAGSAFDEIYGDEWIWLFSVIFTLIVLIGTEIIPKVIGVSYAERIAPLSARLLSFLTVALTPLIAMTEWFSRPFKNNAGRRRISIADLRTMADMARHERLIGVEEQNIIGNTIRLQQMPVAVVMVPRERIVLFDTRQSNLANFEVAAASLHTRYPVSADGTVDGIVGYINFKEIVAMMPSRREAQIQPFIRPLFRVRADTSLNMALKYLLGRKEHVALVEDGQRRVVGMVTLEDLLEEIVGDLTDEFDHLSNEFIEVAPRRWKVGGGVAVELVARRAGIALAVGEPGANLSDWLQRRRGHELRSGDVVTEAGATFTVIRTRRRRAHRVLVEAA